MATLTTSKPETVVTVNRVDKRKPKQRVKGKRSSHSSNACYRCGQSGHYGKDPNCPARGKKCLKCNGADHFAAVCKTKQKKVNCVNSDQNPSSVSGDYAFHIKDQASSGVIPTVIGGVKLNMLVDSGATTNIVDEDTWKTLKAKKIQCASYKQNTKLYPYASDKPLTVIGGFSCDIKVGKQKTVAKFTVVKGSGVPLLGKNYSYRTWSTEGWSRCCELYL
ncbi:uncharacterized protein [Ptychodera flava]|uniref:uncharacterized protein n=1 Tax=Ptychodera flava TaxID=63121 RepID=UPI00396A66DD